MHYKKKIINDPVYGFLNIPGGLIFELIEHPYFQRLRRIRQLGLSYLVYPGATHSRFQHSIGAMHLTSLAVSVLKSKGVEISKEEDEAVMIAVLLHDIGHSPFSHTLENTIIESYGHEALSVKFMDLLNKDFDNRLELAINIFKDNYKKPFLHQLVSGQLDMDRLDYLRRDSFFTGVSEGVIGSERIIKMLDVYDDKLVVEAKGIYSIEKFLIARRLMYWQVYMHKTSLAAELMLMKLFNRIKELFEKGADFFGSDILSYFLTGDFKNNEELIERFSELDDYDIIYFIKSWTKSSDKVLSFLSQSFINRNLPGIILSKIEPSEDYIEKIKMQILKDKNISKEDLDYYIYSGSVSNNAYSTIDEKINILIDNKTVDISEASDMLNLSVLSKVVKKYYVCAPKEILKTK